MNPTDNNPPLPKPSLLTIRQFKQMLKQGKIDKDDQIQFTKLKKQAICKQVVFGGAVLFYTGLLYNNPMPAAQVRPERLLMFCAVNMAASFWFSSPYIGFVDKVKHKYV